MQNPFKEYVLQLGAIVLAFGIAIQTISILGLWFKELIPQLKNILEQLSWWNLWLLIIAPFIIIIGGYYFLDEVYKRIKFNKLIKVKSKKEFISSLNKLEELAYLLTRKHRKILRNKKKEFKIE